jgi:hypothetical protein
LERGRADIERDLRVRFAAVQIGEDRRHPPLEALPGPIFVKVRGGELGGELGLERPSVVAQADAADAAWGCGDEQSAERGRHNHVGDLRAGASARVAAGRHAKVIMGALIHTARGAVAGLVDSGTHVRPPFQFLFEP